MTEDSDRFQVGGYTLDARRYYCRESHLWVAPGEPPAPRARVGFDPLGSETSGDIVAVSFEPVGTRLSRGDPFGQLEAAKFVGPLIAPVAGTITAHNAEILANPAAINEQPLASWLIELEAAAIAGDLAALLHGREEVADWFRRELERFVTRGMIAE